MATYVGFAKDGSDLKIYTGSIEDIGKVTNFAKSQKETQMIQAENKGLKQENEIIMPTGLIILISIAIAAIAISYMNEIKGK